MELLTDLWHFSNMEDILTLQTPNFAEFCVTFSSIDFFAFDKIKCAFTKHAIQKFTKHKSMSISWYYLHLVHMSFDYIIQD